MNIHITSGHNNPPSAIDDARTAAKALSDFLARTPVIQTSAEAAEAKLYIDRVKSTQKDLDAAEEAEARPFYDAWKDAKAKYKPATDYLTKIANELKARIKVYLDAEEAKRRAEAERIRAAAEAAIKAAHEAERLEREAKENASMGELDIDVGAAIEQADNAFADAKKLIRQANVAERDADVRLSGGLGRSISVRTTIKPVCDDYKAAIKAMGLTDGIRDAILTSARAYKKLNGAWPKGISEIEERSL